MSCHYHSNVIMSCRYHSNVMDGLYKILKGLLSITVPQHFASTIKDIVSTSFDLFSAVSEKGENSHMEDDKSETGKWRIP